MAVVASGREEAIRAEIFIRIDDKLLIELTFGREACCTPARFLIVLNIKLAQRSIEAPVRGL
jgi:hypothetical protein